MKNTIKNILKTLVLVSIFGLASCSEQHEHNYEDSIAQLPTCTEAGLIKYTCECGEVINETIPALGHDVVIDEAVQPTCTSDGKTSGSHCSRCNTVLVEQQIIESVGHQFSNEWKTNETSHWHEALCGHDLTKDYGDHEFVEVSYVPEATHCTQGIKTLRCSVCGYEKKEIIPAEGHDIVTTWSKDETYHWYECSCGERVEVAEHIWNNGVVSSEATCEDNGAMTYTCTECGATKVETIPALGHALGELIAEVPSTCLVQGTAAHYECSVCHKLYNADFTLVNDINELVLPLADHTYGTLIPEVAPTCKNTGVAAHYECSVCHDLFNEYKVQIYSYELELPEVEHFYEDKAGLVPTCSREGYSSYQQCIYCGDVVGKSLYEKLPHQFGEMHQAVASTCKDAGTLAYKQCLDCLKYFSFEGIEITDITVEKLPHNLALVPNTGVDATCTTDGFRSLFYCSGCETYYDEDAVSLGGTYAEALELVRIKAHHTPVEIPAVPATDFENGTIKYYECSACTLKFLDEECTQQVIEDSELVDPIKSISVTEALTKSAEDSVRVRGVVVGGYHILSWPEIIIKDLDNGNIIGIRGLDGSLTTASTDLTGKFNIGDVLAFTTTIKKNVSGTDDGAGKWGGNIGRVRGESPSNIVKASFTQSFTWQLPESDEGIPVIDTHTDLYTYVNNYGGKHYTLVKIVGPIYGYFDGTNASYAGIRFWLDEDRCKDDTYANGGLRVNAGGTSWTRPIISLNGFSSTTGASFLDILGISASDMGNYTAPANYFTFEGEMYAYYLGGSNYSVMFLPLGIAGVKKHTSCAPFAHFVEGFAATETAHGRLDTYVCEYCGKEYLDAECTQEIEENLIHYYVHYDEVPPTTLVAGTLEHYECPICEKIFVIENDLYVEVTSQDIIIPMLDHTHEYNQKNKEIDGACIIPTTLHTKGEYYYSCLCGLVNFDGETWIDEDVVLHEVAHVEANAAKCEEDGNIEFYHCATCNLFWNANTFQEKDEISQANTVIAKLGHSYTNYTWAKVKSASEIKPGLMIYFASGSSNGYGGVKTGYNIGSLTDPKTDGLTIFTVTQAGSYTSVFYLVNTKGLYLRSATSEFGNNFTSLTSETYYFRWAFTFRDSGSSTSICYIEATGTSAKYRRLLYTSSTGWGCRSNGYTGNFYYCYKWVPNDWTNTSGKPGTNGYYTCQRSGCGCHINKAGAVIE